MFGRILAAALAVAMMQGVVLVGTASAGPRSREEKVRAAIERLGVGPDSRVQLELGDGRRIAGTVASAGDEGFTVADRWTGDPISVDYGDVSAVRGNNLSTGAKVAIGAGIAAAAIVAFILWASQFE
jgi:hypothetical protein